MRVLVRGSFISGRHPRKAFVSGAAMWASLTYFYIWPRNTLSNSRARDVRARQSLTHFQGYLGTGNLSKNGA